MKLFQHDNLYIINNKEMLDAAKQAEQKSSISIFEPNIFKPKSDPKQNPLSWRTKFGYSLGHFFNDAVRIEQCLIFKLIYC